MNAVYLEALTIVFLVTALANTSMTLAIAVAEYERWRWPSRPWWLKATKRTLWIFSASIIAYAGAILLWVGTQ